MSLETAIQKFDTLPPEEDKDYALKVREILKNLRNPIRELRYIYEKTELPEKIRFNAFYSALAFHWQNRDFLQYRTLVDRYEAEFGHHMMYDTFRCQYHMCQGKSVHYLELAKAYAASAKRKAPEAPNIQHLYASVVLRLVEISHIKLGDKAISEAEEAINRAIAITKGRYATYFGTKASLYGELGRYKDALDLVDKAIEIEPSGSSVYPIRMGKYQEIRSKVTFLEYKHQMKNQQKESIARLEEIRIRAVELLGILTAVIAFLITSIQIGKNFAFEEAVRIMIISGGIIITIFSSYSMIFFRAKPTIYQFGVLLFGIVSIYLSWLLL